MKRFIESPENKTYDLLVIGGGISGAAVAYDAASRGFSVALVEKKDFGCATSAATSKLIHGGFRYIANAQFGVVRESLRERRILANIAPNLGTPREVFVPCYDRGVTRHTWLIRLGMVLYDLLSWDKGRTWDPDRRIGFHRALSAREAGDLEPALLHRGLKRVFAYSDCACLSPERLTLAFIKSAVKCGAVVANYCRVEGFLRTGTDRKRIAGVRVRDLINDREVELAALLTVNCTGPWADSILGLAAPATAAPRIRRSEGIHIITKKPAFGRLIAMVTAGGEGFVVIPWRGHTLIGPTDRQYDGDPDAYAVTREKIRELLDTINEAMVGNERIKFADVLHAYGGLRPLVHVAGRSVRDSSRKHVIYDNARDGCDGLLTVGGGKYTTSRNLARCVMKQVCRKLRVKEPRCVTDKQFLAGCEIPEMRKFIENMQADASDFPADIVAGLARTYGTECGRVLDLARADASLREPLDADGEIAAQAVFAIREELALTLSDILLRRTGLGTLGHPGAATIARLAELAAEHLGWDEQRREKEIREVEAVYRLAD